ncbi:MAG: ABC transporter ATP-binding protein [Clostridia bacterium]|nr:ABC transporter ATP-binding protein [Clostridia bacterium]
MLKRLAKCIREYKLPSIIAPITIMLEVAMEVIIPILMAELIDNGIQGNGGAGDMPYVLKIGIILIVCCVLSMLFGIISGRCAAKASTGFAKNVRHDMYYNIQNFSFKSIDKFSTSSLVTRLTTDVSNLQNTYQMLIRIAFRSPAIFVFSLVMAFKVNASLSLVFLCIIPILALGLLYIMGNAHPIFRRVFKTYDKLNNVVQENLRGIRVVKSYVRADYEIEKFEDVSGDIYKKFSRAEKLVAINAPLMQSCMYGSMLLVAWFGSKLIVSSTMTQGELLSMITYSMQILSSLMMLSMNIVMISISRASAERIYEVLAEETDLTNPENPVFVVEDGSIQFEKVCFSYGKKGAGLCLDNIDLKINSGETVGIIGGTGSAKSTLISMIPRLYDVQSGSVKVGGKDVREYDITALRNEVAIVLQKNELFSGTIKENLRWGNENATDEEIIHACKLAQADGFITSFPKGYDTYIEQGGSNVSGGQKQRLCIARALLKNPKILILDDSTSAVDTATDASIRKAFAEEIPGTTKLIIAQRISSVQFADKIIVLDNGKINAVGTHEELLAGNEIYREVYLSQQKGGNEK